MENKPTDNPDVNALEDEGVVPEPASESLQSESNSSPSPKPAPTQSGSGTVFRRAQNLVTHFNIYFLVFILILVLAIGLLIVGIQNAKKEEITPTISTQSLSKESLEKISSTESKVGDAKSILTVESNSIFSGKVLMRDTLDVAGALKVGGALSLPSITVSGAGSFESLQANNLNLAGNATIQGTLSVQSSLTTSGSANFGGPVSAPQVTTQNLQLIGDLAINKHIDAGGPTPSKTNGNALGNGGTTTLSGTDTAGTITVNIGSSAPSSGCFVTVSFASRFNATPHVVVSPVGAAAGALNYYVDRNSTSFSLCHSGSVPSGSFSFDYIVID